MPFSKRLFDLTFALIALVILFPIILAVAILVRIFLGTPILFKQQRPGYKGRPFYMYKFRSMTNRLARNGSLLPDAERLTRFGRLLRSLSVIDAVPAALFTRTSAATRCSPRFNWLGASQWKKRHRLAHPPCHGYLVCGSLVFLAGHQDYFSHDLESVITGGRQPRGTSYCRIFQRRAIAPN